MPLRLVSRSSAGIGFIKPRPSCELMPMKLELSNRVLIKVTRNALLFIPQALSHNYSGLLAARFFVS